MTKTYLFQPEKKVMKQGFFMTDENGNAVKEAAAGLYHVASKTEDGRVYIKLVNVSGQEKQISAQVLGKETKESAEGIITLLSGDKQAVNSLGKETVAPEASTIVFQNGCANITLPGFSAAVITLP